MTTPIHCLTLFPLLGTFSNFPFLSLSGACVNVLLLCTASEECDGYLVEEVLDLVADLPVFVGLRDIPLLPLLLCDWYLLPWVAACLVGWQWHGDRFLLPLRQLLHQHLQKKGPQENTIIARFCNPSLLSDFTLR